MVDSKPLLNRSIHFILLALISGLFFYKYGSRVSTITALLFIPFLVILYIYTIRLSGNIGTKSFSLWILIVSNIILIAGSFILFSYVNVHDLQVDRWSVITHYWDAYLAGENPYSSTSHMGNYYGSYPFYFILGFPFYVIGEIGWIPIVSLVVFQFIVHFKFKDHTKTLMAFVLALACLCLPYEIITRSTIFANSVLVLLAILLFQRYWYRKDKVKLGLSAFLVGLLVCTRPIFGLVFLIAGIFLMRKQFSWSKTISAGILSLAGLALPFVHLYVLFPTSIMEYNPVAFMTSHFVPTWFYGIYFLLALALGFMVKRKEQIIPMAAIFLFLVVLGYAVRYIITIGVHEAIFDHHIDISYFFMAVPFLIYWLVEVSDTLEKEIGSA